jgi:hypothetical protein
VSWSQVGPNRVRSESYRSGLLARASPIGSTKAQGWYVATGSIGCQVRGEEEWGRLFPTHLEGRKRRSPEQASCPRRGLASR